MLDGWRHSGFNVFAGRRIQPREKSSLENLAAYLIRATFSQKRMDYSAEDAKSRFQGAFRRTGKDRSRHPLRSMNGEPSDGRVRSESSAGFLPGS